MNKKRIYISGKITGIENDAPKLFEDAEKILIENGFIPVNPLKLNHEHDKTWESYMREDIKEMMNCDGVFILDNWKESKGAKIEVRLAIYLDMPIYALSFSCHFVECSQADKKYFSLFI